MSKTVYLLPEYKHDDDECKICEYFREPRPPRYSDEKPLWYRCKTPQQKINETLLFLKHTSSITVCDGHPSPFASRQTCTADSFFLQFYNQMKLDQIPVINHQSHFIKMVQLIDKKDRIQLLQASIDTLVSEIQNSDSIINQIDLKDNLCLLNILKHAISLL